MRTAVILMNVLGIVVTVAGCATPDTISSSPSRPALINHVVFVSLNDPLEAEALIADSDARLRAIPLVISYYAGKHVDTGRTNVLNDYDVGIFVGFDSLEDYSEYVNHPNHVGLVNDWRPRIKALIVRDVLDPTE